MARRKKGAGSGGANPGFEATLWQAADVLRNNMDAAEYKHVFLGLIFLKYISDAFEEPLGLDSWNTLMPYLAHLAEGRGLPPYWSVGGRSTSPLFVSRAPSWLVKYFPGASGTEAQLG